jgi:hypothetical protein
VLLLAHGKEWREALRLAFEHSRSDLVDTVVAPAAAAAAAAALEDIDENVGRVAKYGARLRQLRERRAGLAAALAAADAEAGLPSRQGGGEAWEDDAGAQHCLAWVSHAPVCGLVPGQTLRLVSRMHSFEWQAAPSWLPAGWACCSLMPLEPRC